MTDIVLVALEGPIADVLRDRVARRWDAALFEIRHAHQTLAMELESIRRDHPRAVIGAIVGSEHEALEALTGGADEAIARIEPSATELDAFIDRTVLRGSIRRDGEKVRTSIAHTEKLAALGTLVAGVAHEVNNPLAALSLAVETLPSQFAASSEIIEELRRRREQGLGLSPNDLERITSAAEILGTRAELIEQLEEMRAAVRSITDVVRDLKVFARASEDEPPQLVHPVDIIEQVLRLTGRDIKARGTIERDYGEELEPIFIQRSRLTQVLTNVLINASHALSEVQRELHRVRIRARSNHDGLTISICDTGPGIAPDLLERIFDPFFTTKGANVGTGLGLSISRNLMRRMGGDLTVESDFGNGATFTIHAPRSTAASSSPPPKAAPLSQSAKARNGRASILVVEEDEHVLRAYARVLARQYDVLLAHDSEEAIELLSSGAKSDVVLADLTLSPFDGAHLYGWLTRNRPELAPRTVFVAADSTLPRHQRVLSAVQRDPLPKPAPAALLLDAVASALLL